MALSQAQRQQIESATEAAIMTISLAGDDFVNVLISVILDSTLSDNEIEELGNRIGRIPQERLRR